MASAVLLKFGKKLTRNLRLVVKRSSSLPLDKRFPVTLDPAFLPLMWNWGSNPIMQLCPSQLEMSSKESIHSGEETEVDKQKFGWYKVEPTSSKRQLETMQAGIVSQKILHSGGLESYNEETKVCSCLWRRRVKRDKALSPIGFVDGIDLPIHFLSSFLHTKISIAYLTHIVYV